MKKLNSTGFGVVEGLLIVVILGVIGGVGFYVYNANKNTSNSLKNTANSQADPQKSPSSDNTQATKDNTKKDYLNFTEWGIRITLNERVKDAYYNAGGSSNSLSLRTRSLDIEPDCKSGSLSIAGISRVPKNTENGLEPGETFEETHADSGNTVGNYFYYIQGAQYGCAEDSNNNALLSNVRQGFIEASKTIEAIQ